MLERIKVSAIAILITGVASLLYTVALLALYSLGGHWRPPTYFFPADFIRLFVGSWFFFVFIVATLVIIRCLFLFGRSKEKGEADKEFVLIGIWLWASSIVLPIIALALHFLAFTHTYYWNN